MPTFAEVYATGTGLKNGIALADLLLITMPTEGGIWPETIPEFVSFEELKPIAIALAAIEVANNTLNQPDLIEAIGAATSSYLTTVKAAIDSYKTAAQTAFDALST
jgi:hypothetical protein